MKKTVSVMAGMLLCSSISFSQIESMTPAELRYRDSITKLNQSNAAIAASQEAYNKGIELFNQKKFKEAIASFNKSITSDPNFTAAYYNKGVAENEAEMYQDAVTTFTTLISKQKGPFSASELVSIEYKWGLGDTLANSYNSATGNYQYLDNRDSLIRKTLKLRSNNIIFIHSRANELNLWSLPSVIANKDANLNSTQVLRYEITFKYETKAKKIVLLEAKLFLNG